MTTLADFCEPEINIAPVMVEEIGKFHTWEELTKAVKTIMETNPNAHFIVPPNHDEQNRILLFQYKL